MCSTKIVNEIIFDIEVEQQDDEKVNENNQNNEAEQEVHACKTPD